MKTFFQKVSEQVKEKTIVALVVSMLGIGGTFLWNTGRDLWNLPQTVRDLKHSHTMDSTRAVRYVIKIDSIEKVLKNHTEWLEEDYRNIQSIKSSSNKKPPVKRSNTIEKSKPVKEIIKTKIQ